jgi:hypothetical protein
MRSGESDAGGRRSIGGLLSAEPAQLRRATTFCHWPMLGEPQACLWACSNLRLAATVSAGRPTDSPAPGSKVPGPYPAPCRPRRSASRSPAPWRAQARESSACQWQMKLADEKGMQSRSAPARCWRYPARGVSCGARSRGGEPHPRSPAFQTTSLGTANLSRLPLSHF